MKKLMIIIALSAYGACFGLSAARGAAATELDIEILNRSSIPAVVAIQGQTPTCKVMGTVPPRGRQTFTVPCAKLASITVTFQAEEGTIEKQFTDLGSKTKFTIDSNNVWTKKALENLTFTPGW